MDPSDLLKMLKGEEDILTAQFEQTFVKTSNSTCPKCGGRMETVSNGDELFHDSGTLTYWARCMGCGQKTAISGTIL